MEGIMAISAKWEKTAIYAFLVAFFLDKGVLMF